MAATTMAVAEAFRCFQAIIIQHAMSLYCFTYETNVLVRACEKDRNRVGLAQASIEFRFFIFIYYMSNFIFHKMKNTQHLHRFYVLLLLYIICWVRIIINCIIGEFEYIYTIIKQQHFELNTFRNIVNFPINWLKFLFEICVLQYFHTHTYMRAQARYSFHFLFIKIK